LFNNIFSVKNFLSFIFIVHLNMQKIRKEIKPMILITIFLQKFAENLTFNVIFYLINRYIFKQK